MNYFKNFPIIAYGFADETLPDLFRNIAVYVDVIDEIKNNISFYTDYYIQEGERPDQVSQKLYGIPSYHWTFYLMNDKLRERGWPGTIREIILKSERLYPNLSMTTRTPLYDKFAVGQIVSGNTSGASGVVDHRHLDLGQFVLKDVVGTFVVGETLSSLNGLNEAQTVVLTSFSPEYLAAHHYENVNGETVDIDPTLGPSQFLTEVTFQERLINQNEDLKQIRVINRSNIIDVTNAFREAIRS